jgi:hypothetical protein
MTAVVPVPAGTTIRSTSRLCRPCADKVLGDLAYQYRLSIPAADLPGMALRPAPP